MFWPLVGFAALASAIIANKIILQYLPLAFFVGIRTLTAGGILLALNFCSSPRMRLGHIKKDWLTIMIAALFTTCIPSLLKAYGIKHLLASKAAFIGSLDPFLTALYAYFFFHERLNRRKIIGIGLAFIGALVISFTSSPLEQSLHAFSIFSLPELAAFGSVALSRLGWMFVQRLLKMERYTPLEMNALTMLCSGAILLLFSMATETLTLHTLRAPVSILLLLIFSIIAGNVIGYTMYGAFLKHHSANLVSLTGFSVPVFITIIGWVVLGEALTPGILAGALIIGAGVYVFYKEEVKALLP
jgi:drug/metabolite transporter (DMT)-like permease